MKKQTQAQKIIEYIIEHPGCGNHELFKFSNAPWARISEATDQFDYIKWNPAWYVSREYVFKDGRDHVTYYVKRERSPKWD